MAPSFSSAKTLRAFLALLPLATASAAEPVGENWLDSIEDESICFMQSVASLKPSPHQLLSGAVAQPLDSTNFAQTSVEVSSTEVANTELAGWVAEEKPEGAGLRGAQPAWLGDTNVEMAPSDAETTCSMEGLTPGVCAIAALARPPRATSTSGEADLDYANVDRLEKALFQELDAALAGTHTGFSAAHLAEIEKDLSGFFAALPKNEAGNLDHPTTRFALHQRFLRKHAWYVRSLNPVGEGQTPASAGEALRGKVPEHLQRLIETRQEGRGLGLHELAALVATLEHLIQGDLVERVKAAYAVHGLVANSTVSRPDASDALSTYMAHFLSMSHKSGYAMTVEEAMQERQSVGTGYGGWSSVVGNIHQAISARLPEAPQAHLPFSEVLVAGKEVMERFEAVSAQDCQDMKRDLTSLPTWTSGSVLLSDLHRKALDGSMLFSESTEYLATLGALDQAENGAVSVLVPNYIYSPSNCLGTTSFFDMCCPNECEVIMEQLEKSLLKPDVTPAEVASVIDAFHREGPLSESALMELDDLAHAHGGSMPLHGYHFAHWMHRAFPGECPKPYEEDFSGARQSAEVPAGLESFQAVSMLPFITATQSDLIAELEQEDNEPIAALPLLRNSSKVRGTAGGDLRIDQLKAIASQKLKAGGLKVASAFDASSLAQTRLDVSPATAEEAGSAEEPRTAAGTSGLNVRRLP